MTILFLGLRLFEGSLESFVGIGANAGLLSPKTGVDEDLKNEAESVVGVRASSCRLDGTAERWLVTVVVRARELSGSFLGATIHRDSLVPWVGGAIVVASGLLFGTGLSEGCGGGVARRSSSRWTYVPSPTTS